MERAAPRRKCQIDSVGCYYYYVKSKLINFKSEQRGGPQTREWSNAVVSGHALHVCVPSEEEQ